MVGPIPAVFRQREDEVLRGGRFEQRPAVDLLQPRPAAAGPDIRRRPFQCPQYGLRRHRPDALPGGLQGKFLHERPGGQSLQRELNRQMQRLVAAPVIVSTDAADHLVNVVHDKPSSLEMACPVSA